MGKENEKPTEIETVEDDVAGNEKEDEKGDEKLWQKKMEQKISKLEELLTPKAENTQTIPVPKPPQTEEEKENEPPQKIIQEVEQPKKTPFLKWLL